MPPHRNKLKRTWAIGKSKSEPIEDDNIGRKLLEKMGWKTGIGLGKDNQGMVENPLWKYHRTPDCTTGFKSKDEVAAKESLIHQNAFEELLGELNAQNTDVNEDLPCSSETTSCRERAKNSIRRTRYLKMARAKDIQNYSIKDFKGIIGKDIVKKNLLCENSNENCMKERAGKKRRSIAILENSCSTSNADLASKKKRRSPRSKISDEVVLEGAKTKVVSVPDADRCLSTEDFSNLAIKGTGLRKEKKKKKKEKNDRSRDSIKKDSSQGDCSTDTYNCNSSDQLSKFKPSKKVKQYDSTKEPGVSSKEFSVNSGESEDLYSGEKKLKLKKNKKKCPVINDNGVADGDLNKEENNGCDFKVTNFNSDVISELKDRELQKNVSQDPLVLRQISEAFVGSNLINIKGYGNW